MGAQKLSEIKARVIEEGKLGRVLVWEDEALVSIPIAELSSLSPRTILARLNRSEALTLELMGTEERGGLPRWRLINDYALAKIIEAQGPKKTKINRLPVESIRQLSYAELQEQIQIAMDNLLALRREKDRRTSEPKPRVDVDFTKYTTDKDV